MIKMKWILALAIVGVLFISGCVTEDGDKADGQNGNGNGGESDIPKYPGSQNWEIPAEMLAEMGVPEGAEVGGYSVEGASVQEVLNWYKNQMTEWTLEMEKPEIGRASCRERV